LGILHRGGKTEHEYRARAKIKPLLSTSQSW
jgi:hypothetical protein